MQTARVCCSARHELSTSSIVPSLLEPSVKLNEPTLELRLPDCEKAQHSVYTPAPKSRYSLKIY
jgi:hypothetical protein